MLGKLRTWAAHVGEIKLTEDTNPVIPLQIAGVDVEPILANAAHYDNDGNRRRKVRDLLFAALGIGDANGGELLNAQGFIEVPHLWRGTRRQVDVWLSHRSNVLSPGPIKTPLMDLQPPEAIARILSTIPMGRMGEPDEVAKAAVFLASDDSSFVTGIELFVDGGRGQV